jgi:hypothetical protein
MAKADRVHTTPPTNTPALSQVSHGLFELETPLLRVRSLAYAARMLAGSSEMADETGLALDALADTILDQINEVTEERTRL